MSRRFLALQVEVLEERALPSSTIAGSAGVIVTPAIVSLPPIVHQMHALAGLATGSYTSHSLMPDAGASYQLSGSGHFNQLGNATVTGSIHGVGMIANGRAEGTLTFTNAHGSVTIAIEGSVQPGFTPIPNWFSYHVTKATGSYTHLQDHGTIRIDYHPNPVMVPTIAVKGLPVIAGGTGTFRIAI